MITKTCNTYYAKIYASGPIDVASQIIRKECMERGLCVTIDPTLFIYTGGEEYGYVIGLINYPRFPSDSEEILNRAKSIAMKILEETYQLSVLVMTPSETFYFADEKKK